MTEAGELFLIAGCVGVAFTLSWFAVQGYRAVRGWMQERRG